MSVQPTKLIAAIRDSFPDAEYYYRNGGCFELFRILKTVFPDAVAYYDAINGHVYTKIANSFYDIGGRAVPPTEGFGIMTEDNARKAHRWSKACHV